MLLESSEISVRGGEFRLFDFVIPRLELRSVDLIPHLGSTIFAVVTLGDLGAGGAVQVHTNGFSLNQISKCDALYSKWGEAHARGEYEQGFLEFLPRILQARQELCLGFSVEGSRVAGFVLKLGRDVELLGRFPSDQDVLTAYFGAVLLPSD